MPKVSEVCSYIRSKNAGPFWITLDLLFRDRDVYDCYAHAPQLRADAIGALYDIDATLVKHFLIPELLVLKISYPRRRPQGVHLRETCTEGSNTSAYWMWSFDYST